jgi:dihydroorotate dehydrogenase electron transfer subunit
MTDYPYVTKILEIEQETDDVKTYYFNFVEKVKPGQFFMIWIPGFDEIPMSVSYISKTKKAITFKKVGEATEALYNLKKDDKIGIRGPYGNGFKIYGKKILLVGGGTGVAMLYPAIQETTNKKINTKVIIGFKNKKEIFFKDKLEKLGVEVIVTTDDGSCGVSGFACDKAKNIVKNEKFSMILTCGPEIMMQEMLKLSKNTKLQASLERYIKCSVGICGQCCIGNGLRVCKDGPVFDGETLSKIKDFGSFKRDASGKKIKI